MSIDNEKDLEALRRVGRVARLALARMEKAVRPGITTAELDEVGARVLREHGARSAPKMVYGFPGENCISINDEVVHGIPGDREIQPGDVVKLDVTCEKDGYMADTALTVVVAPATDEKRRLAECARDAFRKALGVAKAGASVAELGGAIDAEVRRQGFRVVRDLNGHGIGRTIHESPSVHNYDDRRLRHQRLTEGLVITVEPIISQRSSTYVEAEDGWTVRTADGSLAAHYEHTIVITRGQPILLTAA